MTLRDRAEPDSAPAGTRLLANEADRLLGPGDDGLGQGQQELPGGGAFHVPPVPLEQLRAEFALQPGDLPAEGRLGGVRGPSGATEAAGLSHSDKRLEEIEFHLYTIVILCGGP